jgi:hypothetical protein
MGAAETGARHNRAARAAVWLCLAGLVLGTSAIPASATPPEPADFDVVVYGTQTSGLAAVAELTAGAPHLRVALISSGDYVESPLAQGLGAEDACDPGQVAGGFYKEWRRWVVRYYAHDGQRAFTSSGRLVYEPEVAARALRSVAGLGEERRVVAYSAGLVDASDKGGARYVDIRVAGEGVLRLRTRFFIDASPEGDLARALGADYRIGRDETVYNDVTGPEPAYPAVENGFVTAPQRYSALLTLQVHTDGPAPAVATAGLPDYDGSGYAATTLSSTKIEAFASSWTMNTAVLPNDKRELNEAWSDWPDVGLSFAWVFEPARREELRRAVASRDINLVRYLQEHGYPQVGIASVPEYLYVREGPRIVGLDTYTVTDVAEEAQRDPVAVGCYCEYDRHDAFAPGQISTTRYVFVPVGALLAAGHPALVVCTAVSADFRAYSSAVRMEHTRAHMGAAAGVIVVMADRLGVEPGEVPYGPVRAKLLERGYRLDLGD